MQKIWESLSKPEELKDRKLSDYFDLSFSALPHKVLAADKFEQSVVDLRKRFVDKSRDDYVFKPAYHKRIPADGVAFYMEGVWVRPISFHSRVPVSFQCVCFCRNKSKQTRTWICPPSRSSLPNSVAMKSRQAHSQSSTSKLNPKGDPLRPERLSKTSVR